MAKYSDPFVAEYGKGGGEVIRPRRRRHTAGASGAYVGPGDVFPNALMHTSWQPYSNAYAVAGGPLVDLIRASDSTTKTINALPSGTPDLGGIASFAFGTTCKISKVYDQTGNGNHLIQNTDANRFVLVQNAFGSLPGMLGSNANATFMQTAGTITVPQPYTISTILNYPNIATGGSPTILRADGGVQSGLFFGNVGFFPDQFWLYSGSTPVGAPGVHGVPHVVEAVFFGSQSILQVDGVHSTIDISSGNDFTGHVFVGGWQPTDATSSVDATFGGWTIWDSYALVPG